MNIGDIIKDDEHYSEYAQWCNANDAHIEEIEKDENGERQFQIVANPKPTFEEVKSEKLSDLATKAQSFEQNVNKEMYFISSICVEEVNEETSETVKKYLLINGDRRTRSNIQDLITYQPTDNVIYRDYENIERTLTKDELKIILKEHVMAGELMYHTKWALEKQIKEATTIDELNAIKIEFPHADFSK